MRLSGLIGKLGSAVRSWIRPSLMWCKGTFQHWVAMLARGKTGVQLWFGRNRLVRDFNVPSKAILAPLGLGIALVYVSLLLYFSETTPPTPSAVDGAGDVYVDPAMAGSVAVRLRVAVEPDVAHAAGRWPVTYTLTFVGSPAPPTQPTPVRWALVLYGDAQLVGGVRLQPPNTTLQLSTAANPPYARGTPKPVQIIAGTIYLTSGNNQTATVPLHGELPKEVFAEGGPKQALSLPRYGRVQLDPLLVFTGESVTFNIGDQEWVLPPTFEVEVDAGPNGTDERVDLASPDLVDPAKLNWRNEDTVTALLVRTSVSAEAETQLLTFALGAVVGAGAASILTAAERLFMAFRRVGRGTVGSVDPAAPPGPVRSD